MECNKDKRSYITWEHKEVGVTVCIDLKPAKGIKCHTKVTSRERSHRVNVLDDVLEDVLHISNTYCA